MKLKDNLYTVVESGKIGGNQSFIIMLNQSCPIYIAHFPGMPITPGVCILQIVEELLAELIGCPLRLCAIKTAKFLSVLRPEGQRIVVAYSSVKEDSGFINSQAIITDLKGNVYARISSQAIIA